MTGISDPNVPSSLLKFWLRDLAEPLIPTELYDACIAVGQKQGVNSEVGNLAMDLVMTLPDINRRVILYMIMFLKVRVVFYWRV
jgi:hypothetical protein